MSISGISRLQKTQYASNVSKEEAGKQNVDASLKNHKEFIEASHGQSLGEIQKNKEAREEQSIWTLLGAIFLGPLVGSLIGGAIGGATNDGEEEAARELKKEASVSDMGAEKAMDQFAEARAALEDTKSEASNLTKFGAELRETGWIGTS